MIWIQKKSTLKGRIKSYFDEEAAKSCTEIGPAKYYVPNKTIKVNAGPKYSIAHKQSSTVYTGPPNSLVHPVDTHGYSVPGPNYRPNSRYLGRGHKKSFGASWKLPKIHGPGPADYKVPSLRAGGPSYSFGSKLPPPPKPVCPGPADYSINYSNMRKSPIYTHRQRTKPSFPESLHYVRK
ncbi:hypothetical protein KUTeg_021253, partial [Tegillarca granosa]